MFVLCNVLSPSIRRVTYTSPPKHGYFDLLGFRENKLLRQVFFSSFTILFKSDILHVPCSIFVYIAVIGLVWLDELFNDVLPVSYTHLDVYKRQVVYKRKCKQ